MLEWFLSHSGFKKTFLWHYKVADLLREDHYIEKIEYFIFTKVVLIVLSIKIELMHYLKIFDYPMPFQTPKIV